MRAGIGFDAHRFVADRPLVLGGVTLEHERGLAGHSDADVLSHAIGDALLGAASLGDLGGWFPSEEKWRDVSSLLLLESIAGAVGEAGWSIAHVDATVIAESPRLSEHVPQMREKVAVALGIDAKVVSVKATTTDGMGFTGAGEGMACMAVASLERADGGG